MASSGVVKRGRGDDGVEAEKRSVREMPIRWPRACRRVWVRVAWRSVREVGIGGWFSVEFGGGMGLEDFEEEESGGMSDDMSLLLC